MTEVSDIISHELSLFISQNIESLAMLETLFFLKRTREQEWTADALAKELRSNSSAIRELLSKLGKRGLIKPGKDPALFRYDPETAQLDNTVEKLSALYLRYPMRIIDEIYSPQKRAIRNFADAFKLKKENENG